MVLLTVDDSVHRPVDVQKDTVVAAPVSQCGVSSKATREEVMHDDGHFELFGIRGPLHHFFASCSGYVQVVALDFACFCLRFVNSICYEQESVTPPLERLGVDVLVVFSKV